MRDAESPRAAGRPHSLTLDGRKRAVVTGVSGVESFNEQVVVLSTSDGVLTLLGEELHIEKLSLDDGQLLVEGRIAALEYDERTKPARGLVGRLFR